MTVWSKIILVLIFLCGASIKYLMAQNYEITLPEKLNYSSTHYEVLGVNIDGILVMNSGKNTHSVSLYSNEMKLKWKKPIALKETGLVNIGKVFLMEDSAVVIYTVQAKGLTILKAVKVNIQLALIRPAVVIDTVTTSSLQSVPKINYSASYLKKRFLIYYEDLNTIENRKLHSFCLDEFLNYSWKNEYLPSDFVAPEIISAEIDDSVNCWFLFGENQVKNFHNDFPYNKLMLVCYNQSTKKIYKTITEETGMILTEPLLKQDISNKQILVAGLYASSPGIESDGIYFNRYSFAGELINKKQIEFSSDLLINLSGNNPPKRNDGFYSFQPSEMIVKKDGGIIFFVETHTISTESFNSPGYGNFGGSSSLTVNYFHYDEVIACSLSDTGKVEWNQVLHKKQQTEGDGGIFSSFSVLIAPTKLVIIFNDFTGGMDVLSAFTLQADGKLDRIEILNAEKKGLLPVSKAGKQISPNEIVIPSLKKGYLQYLKLLF